MDSEGATALLNSAPWTKTPFITKLAKALGQDQLYAVGGAVRDTLLGRPVGDIDLTTPLTPDIVQERLQASGFKIVPTGIAHGTVKAMDDSQSAEITTFRADIVTDGRHAQVAFGVRLEDDAARRDFTVNALYWRMDGQFFDPVDGLNDISAQHLRFIGDPAARIQEDYLRILRYCRFLASHGQGDPDTALVDIFRRHKEGLNRLSIERITAEMMKVLTVPRALAGLEALLAADISLYGLVTEKGLARLICATKRAERAGLVLTAQHRLAALVGGGPERDHFKMQLRLPKKDIAALDAAATVIDTTAFNRPADVRRSLYLHGCFATEMGLLLQEPAPESQLFSVAEMWSPPVFPVTATDLMARGHKPGPALGQALKALEMRWVNSDFQTDRAALLAALPKPDEPT